VPVTANVEEAIKALATVVDADAIDSLTPASAGLNCITSEPLALIAENTPNEPLSLTAAVDVVSSTLLPVDTEPVDVVVPVTANVEEAARAAENVLAPVKVWVPLRCAVSSSR